MYKCLTENPRHWNTCVLLFGLPRQKIENGWLCETWEVGDMWKLCEKNHKNIQKFSHKSGKTKYVKWKMKKKKSNAMTSGVVFAITLWKKFVKLYLYASPKISNVKKYVRSFKYLVDLLCMLILDFERSDKYIAFTMNFFIFRYFFG